MAELKGTTPAGGETHLLRLLVAGSDPESVQARDNLNALIESHLKGMCQLEVIDIAEHPAAQKIVAEIGNYVESTGNAWGTQVDDSA